MMDQPFRKPALNESVRNYIKQYILDHGLTPGDQLPPEGQLAESLGVGRSSVREAIKALQSLGIVEVRHGNGLYVREYNFDPVLETLIYDTHFDTNTLSQLAQVRIWLEVAVIGDAVKQISAEGIAQLETVIKKWEESVGTADFRQHEVDEQFHRVLYNALDNDILIKLLETFWIVFENLGIESIQQSDPEIELRDHRSILQSVKDRDPDLARKRLVQNFTRIQERLNKYIESLNHVSSDQLEQS
jgi:DNA-binding FadR family transcriptional regulator